MPFGWGGVVTERLDMTLVLAWFALLLAGLVMVTSAAAGQPEGTYYYLFRHGLYMAAAMSVFALLAFMPLRFWELIHRPCLLLAFALCLLVFPPRARRGGQGRAPLDRPWPGTVPAG